MAYIDEATIQTIRKKHPIKEIVERYIPLTKKGEDYWGLCPFHADNNASLSVSTRLDMFQCFACKKAGNVFNFISLMENITYREAIHLLAREDGYEVMGVQREDEHSKDYEIMALAVRYYQNNINSVLGENAILYLQQRKIDRDILKKFEIGLAVNQQPLTPFLLNHYPLDALIDLGLSNADEKDIFNDRIMIPIHDLYGNPIGFGGRIYRSHDSSKYVNTKATRIFDKSSILYNYHRAHQKIGKDGTIIVMEGYFDVIRAASIGVCNCVAPMGTSLTKRHVAILKRVVRQVILCFDGDEAGEIATIHALPLLEEAGLDTKIVRLEEKDPDEFILKRGADAFLAQIENPLNVIDFKMSILKKEKNLNDTKEVSLYLDQIIRELLKEKDAILVELTLKRLATQFNLSFETLHQRYLEYLGKENISIVPVYPKKSEEKFSNQYGQATDNLLYYMIESPDVTSEAEKRVSMILDDKKRRLFNEIIYYYHKYGQLVIADFITYLTTQTNVSDTFQSIYAMNLKKEYTNEEIADYIKCINKYYKKSAIDKLRINLMKETDPLKQASISSEIMKIKRSGEND